MTFLTCCGSKSCFHGDFTSKLFPSLSIISKVSHLIFSDTGPSAGKVFLKNLVKNWSLYLERKERERPNTNVTKVKHIAIENLSLAVVAKKSFDRLRPITTKNLLPLPAKAGNFKTIANTLSTLGEAFKGFKFILNSLLLSDVHITP